MRRKKSFSWIAVLVILAVVLVNRCVSNKIVYNEEKSDCYSYIFNRVHESKSYNLEKNFNDFITANTKILKDCKVKRYKEVLSERIGELFKKYSVKSYSVSFSCNTLDFNVTLFEKKGDLYMLYIGLGPCGKENVYFEEGKSYYSERFEEYIIEENKPYAKQNLTCEELNQAIRHQLNVINSCERDSNCELVYLGVEGEMFSGCGEPVHKHYINDLELKRLLEIFNKKMCMTAVAECLPFEGKLSCVNYGCVIDEES